MISNPSPPPPGTRSEGPVGNPRSVGLTISLSIATFGIWTFRWSFWIGEELQRYRNDRVWDIRLWRLTSARRCIEPKGPTVEPIHGTILREFQEGAGFLAACRVSEGGGL